MRITGQAVASRAVRCHPHPQHGSPCSDPSALRSCAGPPQPRASALPIPHLLHGVEVFVRLVRGRVSKLGTDQVLVRARQVSAG